MWVLPVALATLAAGFILPIVIGLIRQVERMDLVILFTVLGLVTVGAGWLGAMLLACMMPRRLPRYVMPPTSESAWQPQSGDGRYPGAYQ
jgi:hypothetical protein